MILFIAFRSEKKNKSKSHRKIGGGELFPMQSSDAWPCSATLNRFKSSPAVIFGATDVIGSDWSCRKNIGNEEIYLSLKVIKCLN